MDTTTDKALAVIAAYDNTRDELANAFRNVEYVHQETEYARKVTEFNAAYDRLMELVAAGVECEEQSIAEMVFAINGED